MFSSRRSSFDPKHSKCLHRHPVVECFRLRIPLATSPTRRRSHGTGSDGGPRQPDDATPHILTVGTCASTTWAIRGAYAAIAREAAGRENTEDLGKQLPTQVVAQIHQRRTRTGTRPDTHIPHTDRLEGRAVISSYNSRASRRVALVLLSVMVDGHLIELD